MIVGTRVKKTHNSATGEQFYLLLVLVRISVNECVLRFQFSENVLLRATAVVIALVGGGYGFAEISAFRARSSSVRQEGKQCSSGFLPELNLFSFRLEKIQSPTR